MADGTDAYDDEVVEELDADDIEWFVDEDGVEYFLDGGVRYEMGEDGYAYPVETVPPPAAAAADPSVDDLVSEVDAAIEAEDADDEGWDDWADDEEWAEDEWDEEEADVAPAPAAAAAEPAAELLEDEAYEDDLPEDDDADLYDEELVEAEVAPDEDVGEAELFEYLDEDGAVLGYGDETSIYLDPDGVPMDPIPVPGAEVVDELDADEQVDEDAWEEEDWDDDAVELDAEWDEDEEAGLDGTFEETPVAVDDDEMAEVDASPFSPAASVAAAPRAAPAAEEAAPREVLLELRDVKSGYGSLPVLHGVSTSIRKGETAVLLGLNGAGKTTTALNVCGALRTWSGQILFDGEDITDYSVKQAVKAGIIMCPEGRRVFPELSVARNLQIGAWMQRADKDWIEQQTEQVFTYFPRLRQRTAQLAGSLSGGEQQMLAMSRALMARPRLLIIDEASMGLAPVIVKDVFDIIAEINSDGVTVLLIEQNVGALEVADLGLVMEQGRMVKELRGERLRDRREVTEVLMGDGGGH